MIAHDYELREHIDGSHWFIDKKIGDENFTVVDDLTESQGIRLMEFIEIYYDVLLPVAQHPIFNKEI